MTSCGSPQPEIANSPKFDDLPLEDLTLYTTTIINTVGKKLPDYYKDHTTSLLIATANDRFDDVKHRKYWIALLAVESGFERTAESPKGARGLGQLMPKYANDFGKPCGVDKVRPQDLWDNYLNAWLSACYFDSLIRNNGGIITYALIAYNAGPYSKDLEAAKRGQRVSSEPANYVKEVNRIKEIGEKND